MNRVKEMKGIELGIRLFLLNWLLVGAAIFWRKGFFVGYHPHTEPWISVVAVVLNFPALLLAELVMPIDELLAQHYPIIPTTAYFLLISAQWLLLGQAIRAFMLERKREANEMTKSK